MSKVLITRSKLDGLASTIAAKSGATLPLTIAQMDSAVQGIETGGNTFVVTLSYNEQTDMWEPDKTFAEIEAAYDAEKTITVQVDGDGSASGEMTAVTSFLTGETIKTFQCVVVEPVGEDATLRRTSYSERSDVEWHSDGQLDFIVPDGSMTITSNGTNIDVAQYATVDVSVPTSTPSLQSKSVSYTPSETAQSATVTADSGYDGLNSVAVSVGAISSTYVGSGITQRSSTDLTASGATVTVPAGYYASQASKAVASGSAGTPTATKGTVSNHSVSVTPSVTNTTGYITGGTKNGTAVTVSASELVSGTLSITSSGTTDVTNYASASVAAGGATASATKGTVSNHSVTVTPSVTRTAGYVTAGSSNGTAVTVSASELVSGTYTVGASGTHDVTNYASASVAAGGATASATKGTVSNHSITVTPSVTRTAGYITAGTANGTAVTVSASELVSGSQTITDNGTVDVTNLASVVVNIAAGGAAYRRIEVCPQQTLTPDSDRKASPTGMAELNVGDDYIVTLDGTEYFTTCCLLWNTNHVIGDANCIFSLSGDLTYPFTAVTVTGVKEIYFTNTNQHTIKIERLELLTDPVTYVTYHTSSSAPTSAQGDNGDIWLVTA